MCLAAMSSTAKKEAGKQLHLGSYQGTSFSRAVCCEKGLGFSRWGFVLSS
jgi:hypothetical protein